MNQCILCGGNSGFDVICNECKEAFIHYRTLYFTRKKLNETTELDEPVFEQTCKSMALDEVIEDNITGMFPQSCDETTEEIIPYIKRFMGDNEWLNKQEGRMDAFIDYIKTYIRKYYDEHDKISQ